MSPEERIAVIGMGTMGRGIAEVLLTSGFEVACVDVDKEILLSSTTKLKESLTKSFERGSLKEKPDILLRRLVADTGYETVRGCQYLIEAVSENMAEKRRVLQAAEPILDANTVMATNTSSLSVSDMAGSLRNPSRFVGMHFFNPVQKMTLVEIVCGRDTSEVTVDRCVGLATKLGKTPIVVEDSPGFVVNRLLIPYLLEAGRLLDQGVASPKDVDMCMKLGAGHPMGPFELADLIGIDIVMDIAEELRKRGVGLLDEEIPQSFQKLRNDGKLGRKTRRGFFDY